MQIVILVLCLCVVLVAILGYLYIVSKKNVETSRTKIKLGNFVEYENEMKFREESKKILNNASRSF